MKSIIKKFLRFTGIAARRKLKAEEFALRDELKKREDTTSMNRIKQKQKKDKERKKLIERMKPKLSKNQIKRCIKGLHIYKDLMGTTKLGFKRVKVTACIYCAHRHQVTEVIT